MMANYESLPTPKQLVVMKYPRAEAMHLGRNQKWIIYADEWLDKPLGHGPTPQAAWAYAARRITSWTSSQS